VRYAPRSATIGASGAGLSRERILRFQAKVVAARDYSRNRTLIRQAFARHGRPRPPRFAGDWNFGSSIPTLNPLQ
jgi:hypothetical protein